MRWDLAPAAVRERALLLLLALRAHVPRRWWWAALLGIDTTRTLTVTNPHVTNPNPNRDQP